MKIYTKTGDDGNTGLFGGGRVPKSHLRVDAYGTVDELNSFIGLATKSVVDKTTKNRLHTIQHDLFALGAVLATAQPDGIRKKPETPDIPSSRIAEMETWIDAATGELDELKNFIIPDGTQGAIMLHICRTLCRRAERAVVALSLSEEIEEGILPYLNRLSDLFFIWARLDNHQSGEQDVPWNND